jgi:hypothetical protein
MHLGGKTGRNTGDYEVIRTTNFSRKKMVM